jgi:hypothetical protein
MSTSVLGTTLDAIVDGLNARPNLSTVNVFSGAVSMEEAGLECVALGSAELEESPSAMGGNRLEEWKVYGELLALAAWQGDTETTIRHARDRAFELFAEVESYINDTYTGSLPDVAVTAGKIDTTFGPDGRYCTLGFTLTVRYLKNP